MRRFFSSLALTGVLLGSLPILSFAQGTPGITLFGGPEQANMLNFYLQSGQAGRWDRYKLRIPANKLNLAVALISITYPEYYKGKFDPDKIEVRIQGESVPLEEVVWDADNNFIEIYPTEPIPAGNKLEIVMSNVKNPTFGGMFHFNANIRTPGDVPLLRYVGTWVLSID
ncbi:hypothetical protein M595_5215 [Lyngbya aestuarii BL J]|uniref:DUF2808 domain-containing protein n=1 Tax=Lyngbya aestuarii BL J TaxID=1348334 RepID=U7QAJ1_9CYAN|nr:DUF2808 domain-containing protein [Lyngbya aestuarii]ERT04843.1 hypothetical protein M595_5215 [Lyngbya aestuarii BL J]